MSNNNQVSTGGLSLGTVMFLIFMTLKLTDNIDWSWVWVTSPLWIGAGLFLLILMVALIVTVYGETKTR